MYPKEKVTPLLRERCIHHEKKHDRNVYEILFLSQNQHYRQDNQQFFKTDTLPVMCELDSSLS